MRTKLRILATLLLICLCLPHTAAAADSEEIPYPPRNFLYVVDCSGSMRDYGDALDVGRVMLRDLLPASTTTVIAFSTSASVVTDKLIFGGETSVLSGLEEADRVLKEQLQEATTRETTVLLFSDMQSTVSADDGKTPLTDGSFQTEETRLRDIEDRWSQHISAGNMRFYSLRWFAEEPGAYPVTFDPSGRTANSSKRFELDSTQEILKTCVEAYAHVLTGIDGFQWMEPETLDEGGKLRVQVEESYRTFLYLSQAPDSVTDSVGHNIATMEWRLPAGGCVLMLENTKADMYTLHGVSGSCSRLTIPHPQLTMKISPNQPMCYNKVTISVAMSAGNSYLGYNTRNSECFMEIRPLQEGASPKPVTSNYNEQQNCYEFEYTPQKQGSHEISILYHIPGDKTINLERLVPFEVEPYEIKLTGDTRRAYEDLRRYLQSNLKAGDEFSFSLSDYFKSPYQRLEFTVAEPETPKVICWEPSFGPEGQVTIQALQEGTASLQYSISYYEDGADQPEHTQSFELLIQASRCETSCPLPHWAILIIIGVAAAGVLYIFLLRRRRS